MKLLGPGSLGFVTALLVTGCGGTSSKPLPTPRCLLDSDCNSPLKCVQGYCVTACKESRDCPASERCIVVSTTAATGNSCQPFEKATCNYSSDCTDPLVCAGDRQCRNQCQADKDCTTGQKCTSVTRLCADPVIDKNYDPASNEFKPGSGFGDGGGGAPGDGGADTPLGGDGGPGRDGPDAETPAATCAPGLAGFHPSNLPTPIGAPAGLTDYTQSLDGTFDTDALTFTVAAGGGADGGGEIWKAVAVTLQDGREAAAAFFKSYSLVTGKTLSITGRRPLIIAADGDIRVDGSIVAVVSPTNGWYGGGAPGPNGASRGGVCPLDNCNGGGAHGGLAYTDGLGAGGGGFCGLGGSGSALADGGAAASGGSAYGTPELVPLVGGSSGGSVELSSPDNHGGGALELVSGSAVVIDNNATINLGGGSLVSGTPRALGGGSGGAILLEGPTVTVRGILTVNGGAGSSAYAFGQSGLASIQPAAPGGTAGRGSDGTNVAGQPATLASDSTATAGGGGAGRIRMNTGCGGLLNINSAAVFSPGRDTTCVSSGTLR